MTQPCPNCPTLRAEVDRLEGENLRLRTEVNHLRRIIATVCRYCYAVANVAVKQMSNHQARGTWSYFRGHYEVASVIYNALRGE